jgi:ATP-dependent RNA helicase RhlE
MPLSFIKRLLHLTMSKKTEPMPDTEASLPRPEQSPLRRPTRSMEAQRPPRPSRGDARPQNTWKPQAERPTPAPRDPGQPNEFYGLNIAPALLAQVEKLGFHTPTPIQRKTIPTAIEGKDIVGIAQTGTGKTLAFGIPLVQRLTSGKGKALILAPTRELALQIEEALRPFVRTAGLRSGVFIGGAAFEPQISNLRQNRPRVIIATPGRLIDLMERGEVRLDDAHILVLDEADRMLDMGFAPQISRILQHVPKDRQTMLFSATMPPVITAIAASYMKLPVRTEVAPSGTAAETVKQELFVVNRDNRTSLLFKLLDRHTGSVLLFTRTRRGAARVASILRKRGYAAAEIHSDRSLSQRTAALNGFKQGKYRILVATDIAARGIDVIGIELVLNYDLPDEAENYVHRIGRTGRAGKPGHAISIACPDQAKEVADIERVINTSIAISSHPEIPSEKLLSFTRTTAADFLYGPPKGRKTGREKPILAPDKRPEHRKEWGR